MVALDDRPCTANGSTTSPRTSTRARRTTRSCPIFKGSYAESMTAAHRRVPRRQRAPHPAGVRGRHRHHDGEQGRDRAGRQGDEGRRREVRPEPPTCPPWPATTRRRTAQMLSFPFNSSTTIFYYQQGRLQGRRPRPEQAADDLARGRARRRQAEGERPQVPVHARPGTAGRSSRASRPGTTSSSRPSSNGLGGIDARLKVNSPLHVRHIENLANMAKQGLFVYKGRGNKRRQRRSRRASAP